MLAYLDSTLWRPITSQMLRSKWPDLSVMCHADGMTSGRLIIGMRVGTS